MTSSEGSHPSIETVSVKEVITKPGRYPGGFQCPEA